jgi:hypothetical protein
MTARQLLVGWLVEAGLLARFEYVLVTSLDSDTQLSESGFGKDIASFDARCCLLGSGVLIPGSVIREANAALDLFVWFDEVWCYDSRPKIAKPDNVTIGAPLNLSEEPIPDGVHDWMLDSDCRLGVGDGIGLNFVTPDSQLRDRLWNAVEGSIDE